MVGCLFWVFKIGFMVGVEVWLEWFIMFCKIKLNRVISLLGFFNCVENKGIKLYLVWFLFLIIWG